MSKKLIIEELVGTYKVRLASSIEDNKILYSVLTIKDTPKYSFHVVHNGQVVHTSDYLRLALSAYNKIESIKQPITGIIIHPDAEMSICTHCEHNDICKKYLHNPGDKVIMCANYS